MKKNYSVNTTNSRNHFGTPSRLSSLLPLLLVAFCLFGVNERAWGGTAKLTLRAIANSSKGGYVMVSESSNASFSGTATDQSKEKKGDTGRLGLSSKQLTLYAYASAKAGCVFLGWAESATGTIISTDTKISYTTDKLYSNQTVSKTYYAIFARMVANTPAAGSTTSFEDTNVGSESGWKQIIIDHAHAGTVAISQSGNDGDFFVGATTGATTELSSFESTTETTQTLYVKFVPQNNGLCTCTLTVSSNNGLSSLTYYLTGYGYKVPSITWVDGDGNELTSGETTLSVGDVLRASCTTGQTVSYTGYNSNYFTAGTDANGNPILTVNEGISGTINNVSVTGNLAKNTSNYYAAYSDDFSLSITNLVPQTIEWTNDLSDISDEEIGHTITLNAVAKNAKTGANSGQTITYTMTANSYMSLSGNVLTINNIGGPVAITATAAGNENYAPTSVTKYATVIDMSHACATSDNYDGKTLDKDHKSLIIYPTLPGKLTFNVVRSSSWFMLNKFTVKEYSSNNSLLATTEYNNSEISTSGETKTINCNANTTKIELYCDAYLSYSCTVSNVSTTRVTTSSVSLNSLSYSTDPGQSLGKTIKVSYSNIPVFLSFKSDEDANVSSGKSLWSLNTAHFGGCGKKGSTDVTVSFKSDKKGNYTDKLYVRNNVGDLLHTIDLSASVTAQKQFLKSWNIANTYNTTDQVTLQASTTVDNTDFTFTATTSNPANIVTITNAGVMTFSGSGTATIRAYQPGDAISQEFETTHDITINKVTPDIATEPTVAEIKYKDSFANNQLSEGLATVTLRGEANTEVEGTFTWTNPGQISDKPGSHDYSITFTPTDGGMYTNNTFTQSVTISRANGAIEMNNGEVKVKVADINDDLNECKIDLDGLVASKIEDAIEASRAGTVSYEVISNDNKAFATIDGDNKFSATKVGTYTIRATQAQTDYYEAASDEFTVTVNRLTPTIVFDNTDNPEYIYSGDVIETPAYRKYNGHEIDRAVSYVSSDPSITGAIYVNGTTLTARDVTAQEGSAVEVTITASASADDLYNAPANSAHNYAVRAKRSPVFTMEGVDNAPVSKTLNIGETAIITYNENTNKSLTVGTSSEHSYISYSHDTENRCITVTAVKGSMVGDGVQDVIVNQPGNARLFDRSITYTFTVKKKVSALSLAGLTTSMQVEDTVATPYTGLANTEAAVQFSCSPEGSMKMENGKLIALQAGTNTVTFSQPATEYWTGISESKTITVSKKNPNVTTELQNRHAWYSIIEHPFKSLNTEKSLRIESSNENLAKYIAEEDKIYVYGTSGNVTFTVNQDENYKYNAVENYQKTFEIFQPNNRLPFTLSSSNLEDYKGGGSGTISWDDGGVLCGKANGIAIGGAGWDWSAKYIILSFVGIPDVLSFDFKNANSAATQYGWHFYQSSDNANWIPLKEYDDLLMNATGGTSEGSERFRLNPDTRFVKLEYHGNFGGRFKNVSITERKEIVPQAATTDFGLGFNGNDPTTRTIKVDWYNVKPCTVTITGTDADKFILDAGSTTINSLLDNFGTAELTVSYKHETNSSTSHTATLHIQDVDGNYADIALTGQTTPAPQDIVWRNDLTPMPLNGVFPNAAMVGSNQPLTLVSDDTDIVRVDENNTLVGVAAGTARVTAVAEGSNKWAETTSYIDIEVTTKNVQFITWNDNLSNRKCQDGQTVNITLTATSSVGLPITYELDEAAQTFASISGDVLSLTGWGKGQVIAHQYGTDDYVAVQAVKSLVSRNPAAGCRPLVGEYTDEYTIWTLGEKEIELDGEPATVEFDAKCDASALWGLYVGEFYDGYYHEVAEISRLEGNNLTSSYKHFGPFALQRNTSKVRIYTKTGATMNRTFKNVEVTLAKYLELADNQLHFEQVDKGSTKTQSFYINYSNLTGVLDVELETESTQFEVLTETAGEDCGDVAKNKQIQIRFTGSTLGTEENVILVHNNDQSLRIPVSATVVLPSQTITWEPELNILTTDHVTLSATATSELPVSFTSGNTNIAEVVCEAGVYSLNIKTYGDVKITAHQPGDNVNWGAATDKTLTFHISRAVPEVNTWPTAGGVVLPNTVSASTLTGGVAPEGISGSFHWQDGSQNVTRESHTFNVVFEPTNTDYYEPVSHPLEIEILKTPQTITWNRADESEESCAATIILDATASSGLPVTYASSDETTAYIVDDVVNEVPVKKLYVLKGGEVTITATQSGDDTYDVAPSVAKKITLIRVIPTIEILPTATDMYVHHFLSNSTLKGGVVKAGENTVLGVFNWQDGSEVMDEPGTNHRTVVFQPYNSDYYQPASAVIDVEVKRFAPMVKSTITTEPAVYGTPMSGIGTHGTVLANDSTDPAHPEIKGTWSWKLDENVVLGVDDHVTKMIFHPDHTEWYDDVEFDVNITITEYTDFSPTAAATIIYGQTLAEAEFVSTTHNPLDNSEILTGNFQLGIGLDPNACYGEGEHTITIALQVTSDDNFSHDWKEGTATLTVQPGFIYNGTDGVWNDGNNWIGGVPDANGESRVTINENVNVISDVEVSSLTISAGKTVTIKKDATLTVGANNSFNRETYGNIHVEEGGKLILTSGRVDVNNLYLDASLGNRSLNISANSGQIRNVEQIDVNGDAYFDLVLDPVECSYGWYDFTVPFPVDNRTGISCYQNGAWKNDLRTEVDYAVMTYHEEIRANGQYGWKKYYGVMQPGKCYSIAVDYTYPLHRFRKVAGASFVNAASVVMTSTDSGTGGEDNIGWNCIGNGTLTHATFDAAGIRLVQVYDHASNSYSVLEGYDSEVLPVGTAIFVQVAAATSMIFTEDGENLYYAPTRTQGRTLSKYLLQFGLEGDATSSDRLYLSASEDALSTYQRGHDLAKFGVSTKVPQIWADAYGKKLCDVEAPLVADQAIIPISLYAAQTGTYTLETVRGPQDASLYLMYNGAVIWNLSQSAYTFDLTRGTNSAYSLLLTAEAPAISTGSDNISGEKTQQVEKILLNGQLYILRDGQMYDATGKKVK